MLKPIDINAELSKLSFLHDRGPDTTDEEKSKSFTTLSSYRDGGIFTGSFSVVGHNRERGGAIEDVNDLVALLMPLPLTHAGKTTREDTAVTVGR